jgi:peptidylprolyl isomerase
VAELSRPDVEPPTGPAPEDLVIEDITVGDGPEATSGSLVSAHYVGVTHDGGEQFDASWDRGVPLDPFQLGAGQVIPGWDRGIVGMRVGGRRKLVIPPELAYGPQGSGPIGPNETLIFVVDLLKIG